MKNDRLIPGLILVLVGLVILFDNLGYIDFDWTEIWHLWPLFLIVAGVNLVFAHSKSGVTTIIKIVVVLGAFLFIIGRYGDFGPRDGKHNHLSWHHHGHDDDDDWFNFNDDHHDNDTDNNDDNDGTVRISRNSNKDTAGAKVEVKSVDDRDFYLPYTANAKTAELNVSGAASDYTLNDTTNQLFAASTEQNLGGKYQFWSHNDGSNYVLNFEMKSGNWHSGDHENTNKTILKLNPSVIWDLNLELGAVATHFDLSKFKIRRIKLDGGAGSFDIKLGEPLESTNVKLATAAASDDISIPRDAACRIESSTFLASTNYEEQGFRKVDGGYETPGFSSAKNKLYISMDGMAGSFNIHRY